MDKSILCNYFNSKKCSSCHLLPNSIEEIKNQKILSLNEIFSLEVSQGLIIRDMIETPKAFHSRAKAKFSVGGTSNDPIIGITNKNLMITELEECPLHFEIINNLLPTIKNLIKTHRITPYDIKSKSGELKGLIIKSNSEQDQLILRFILKSKKHLEDIKSFMLTIQEKFNYIKIISVNIQPIPHQILEGEEEIILTKKNTITEKYENIELVFGPTSFSQVTPYIAHKLYKKVAEIISTNNCQGLLDLFCGVGGFSIIASEHIKWGIGVEISDQAIQYAKQASEINHIEKLTFLSGDVESFLESYNENKPDVIICNPPRRGLNNNICDHLKTISPNMILYSSCNPITLQRDLEYLSDIFIIEELIPFDMFPLTKHMEVLAILKKKH
ncbi:MAG: 23S rRNA (uracil(1939)-C(5))-methyltransferase RlmD [Planctomycetota bacterium]|nr:MAG: 23S rRNA (uracil(1939)-C(5))-methyltransferase RlmD [Planctomycetota bacterium]